MSILGIEDASQSFVAAGSISPKFVSSAANENIIQSYIPVQFDTAVLQHGGDIGLGDGRYIRASSNLNGWQVHAKRALDITMSGLALVALFPLFVLVAIAIKLESPGPVFFVQGREGKAGRSFKALKFRSMRNDDCDSTGIRQTVAGDSRITKVGSLLRRTSIDELPQLINVIRGDMSLVGPRPHVSGMLAAGRDYRSLVPYYDLRLLVTPGLTGLAQSNGLRGPTTDANLARLRIDADIAYIEDFSLWLDVKIIFQTLKRELLGGTGH